MVRALYALVFVLILILIPIIGVGVLRLDRLFLVFIPYLSIAIFLFGLIYRLLKWGSSPQPFRIPLTAGQQRSLSFVRSSFIENPYNKLGVFLRMLFEILFFRSLLRNEKAEIHESRYLRFISKKWLWFFAIIFHYSLLAIFLRHFRFFLEPIPELISKISKLDNLFEILSPSIPLSEILVILGLIFLILRRLISSQIRYISLVEDYFALFLIGSVVLTGIMLRYFFRVDLLEVKTYSLGIFKMDPVIPKSQGITFSVHIFLVSFLFAYFPFGKLLHAPGVFFSPTRNLENNSREKRHVNPWDYPVKVRTYEEWEDEFREMMKEANIPLEKEE